MKITVIGTINKDLILPFQSTPIESFGGIFYNISILSNLLDSGDEIIPVSFIGEDIQTPIMAVLEKMKNVSTSGLIPVKQKNHKVILEYVSPVKRKEKALFNFPSLTWRHVKPFLDSDIIMVNMITGWDISRKVFEKISKQVRDKLFFDVHFLVMDVDNLGRHSPRMPDKIEKWLKGANFVQMNNFEYEIIAGEEEKKNFFKKHFKPNQVMLITKGNSGAETIYYDYGKIVLKNFDAFNLTSIVDTTGCGDAFGAGFVFKYLQTKKIDNSVKFANLVAAANALLKGTNEVHQLREVMNKIKAGSI